uniref:Chitin-binding type-2 domain-containing protein n=1 Tax=Tetranychus urticae TaxID=32264 RepID=T1KU67_TETUR
MIVPQSTRNRKVWQPLSSTVGSDQTEQEKETVEENKGEPSSENVDKRWPLISKENIESEIFRDEWRTEKSPILGLTSNGPDWNNGEDPFSRIDKSVPHITTPIYHRDVEEIRNERKTENGYDKSVSRTSKISWDDKEEFRGSNEGKQVEPIVDDRESIIIGRPGEGDDQAVAPYSPTRLQNRPGMVAPLLPGNPSAPAAQPQPSTFAPPQNPVTVRPTVATSVRTALGLNTERPNKKYVWFEMAKKKSARSSGRQEITTTQSPQDYFTESITATAPSSAPQKQKAPKKAAKQPKTSKPKVTKSVWGLRNAQSDNLKLVDQNRSEPSPPSTIVTEITGTPIITSTRVPFWADTSTKSTEDLIKEWEVIPTANTNNGGRNANTRNTNTEPKKNNLKKRKGQSADTITTTTNSPVYVPTSQASFPTFNPFTETRATSNNQTFKSSASKQAAKKQGNTNDGSFNYMTKIDHGPSPSPPASSAFSFPSTLSTVGNDQRSGRLQTKGGSSGKKASKSSPSNNKKRSSKQKQANISSSSLSASSSSDDASKRFDKLIRTTNNPSLATQTVPTTAKIFNPTTTFASPTTTTRSITTTTQQATTVTTVKAPSSPATTYRSLVTTNQPVFTVTPTFSSDIEDVSIIPNRVPGEGLRKLGNLIVPPNQRSKETEEELKEVRLEDLLPGIPNQDYSTLKTVPKTAFRCSDQQYPGYYGDVETKCQVFHICQSDGRQDDFICPIGTVFNQMLFVCDWWNNFRCEETPNYYEMNANLYDYSKDPSASNSGTTSNVNNTNNKNNNNREIATRFGDKMSGKSEKLVSENEETTSAGELPSTSSVYFVDDYKEATKGKSSAAKSKSSSSPLTVGRRASAALERESEPVEDKRQ